MKKQYRVTVVAQNIWNADGTVIVERECPHKHSTVTGAYACLEKLQNRNESSVNIQWHRAQIRRIDPRTGRSLALSLDEVAALF